VDTNLRFVFQQLVDTRIRCEAAHNPKSVPFSFSENHPSIRKPSYYIEVKNHRYLNHHVVLSPSLEAFLAYVWSPLFHGRTTDRRSGRILLVGSRNPFGRCRHDFWHVHVGGFSLQLYPAPNPACKSRTSCLVSSSLLEPPSSFETYPLSCPFPSCRTVIAKMDYGYFNQFLGREVDRSFWGTRTQHIVGVAGCLAVTDHLSQSAFGKDEA